MKVSDRNSQAANVSGILWETIRVNFRDDLQLKLYAITRVGNQKGMDLCSLFLKSLPVKPWRKWMVR